MIEDDEPFQLSWRVGPRLDAYIGLLEAPKYVLYLGLRDEAKERIKQLFPEAHTIFPQAQYFIERMETKYTERVGVIDINRGYRLCSDAVVTW
jgi:hypothetical protein